MTNIYFEKSPNWRPFFELQVASRTDDVGDFHVKIFILPRTDSLFGVMFTIKGVGQRNACITDYVEFAVVV